MKKYYITIDSAGAQVQVSSTSAEWIHALASSPFLKSYVPNCRILRTSAKRASNLSIASGAPSFHLSHLKATYMNTSYEDRDIVSIVELLLEYKRQEMGIYCLHSSSAILGGKNIIFWGGASGMGKTRLSIALSEKYAAEMFSDEKTLLNLKKNTARGGVSAIYLAKPYLKNKFENVDFHQFIRSKSVVPVDFFVYPNVENNSRSLHVERWDTEKFNWHLYEELSRKIRGTSRRVLRNTLPVLSIDSLSIAKRRSEEVNAYTKKVPCYYMRGSEKLICEQILKLNTANRAIRPLPA